MSGPTVIREKGLELAIQRRSAKSASLEPARAPDQLSAEAMVGFSARAGPANGQDTEGKSGGRALVRTALDMGVPQSRGDKSFGRLSTFAGSSVSQGSHHIIFRREAIVLALYHCFSEACPANG